MIGPRVGVKGGPRVGPAVGVGSDEVSAAGITRDALSGKYVPATSAEWASLIALAGLTGVVSPPSALWLLQESSGNAADSIGGFPLTASGTLMSYQQSESGWSRKGIKVTDGGTGKLESSSASLPDILTASMTTLLIANVTLSNTSTQVIMAHGTTTINRVRITSTPRVQPVSGANTATGTVSPYAVVRPYVLRTNRTAGSCVCTTDTEKLTPTFDATVTGKRVDLGGSGLAAPTVNMLYACNWHGAAAEISDANLKLLEQAMGFTITWS